MLCYNSIRQPCVCGISGKLKTVGQGLLENKTRQEEHRSQQRPAEGGKERPAQAGVHACRASSEILEERNFHKMGERGAIGILFVLLE